MDRACLYPSPLTVPPEGASLRPPSTRTWPIPPFALSLSKSRRRPRSLSRHSCEGRNPEGESEPVRPEPVEGPATAAPPLASFLRRQESRGGNGAVRPEPVEWRRRPRSLSRHSCEGRNPEGGSGAVRPEPVEGSAMAALPLASFLRRQESRGGKVSPFALSLSKGRRRPRSLSRHSCEGRNPEWESEPVRPEPVEGPATAAPPLASFLRARQESRGGEWGRSP